MKLLFKQRLFSWFDSYDIYDEFGNTVYVVKGQLSWSLFYRAGSQHRTGSVYKTSGSCPSERAEAICAH